MHDSDLTRKSDPKYDDDLVNKRYVDKMIAIKKYTRGDIEKWLINGWSGNGANFACSQANGLKMLTISIRNGTSRNVMCLPKELAPTITTGFLVPATNCAAAGYVEIYPDGLIEVSSNIFTSGSSNLVFTCTYF